MDIGRRSTALSIAAILGVCVSSYALYVEWQKEADPSYVASCDISEKMMCSEVLTSKYGKILSYSGLVEEGSVLDVPNALLGSFFYLLMFLHPFLPSLLVLAASTGSVGLSLFLAKTLYYDLQDFCLVCVTSYLINFFIFALAARRSLEEIERGGKAKGAGVSPSPKTPMKLAPPRAPPTPGKDA